MCGAIPRQPDTIRHRGRDMPKRDTPTVAVIFPEIVTRRRAAKMLAVSTSLLKTWNRKKIGPPCIKRGAKQTGRAVYRLDLLQAWVEAGCPMEPWGEAPSTNTKPAPVAALQITPRVKTGKPPENKRPPIDANRSRVKEPKPPREGGIDGGAAYPRPPGRQRQRRRVGGAGGKSAERPRITNGKAGLADPLQRPSTVAQKSPRGRGVTAAARP